MTSIGKGKYPFNSCWLNSYNRPLRRVLIRRKCLLGIPSQTMRTVMRSWLFSCTPPDITEQATTSFIGPITAQHVLFIKNQFPGDSGIDAGAVVRYLTAKQVQPAINGDGTSGGVSVSTAGISLCLMAVPTDEQKRNIVELLSDTEEILMYANS